jgi:hypothetical protein
MFRSNLSNLIPDAISYFEASASDGKWRAYFTGYGVDVYHYETHMFTFLNDGTTVPVNSGRGSQSDRVGVSKITKGAGPLCAIGYRKLYTTPFPDVTKSPAGYIVKLA